MNQELKPCQRVEACIADVMDRFPRDSKEYYVEVHQHLAPLARQLERELDVAKSELARHPTSPSPNTGPKVWIKHLTGADCKPDGRCYDIAFTSMPGYIEYSAPASSTAPTDEAGERVAPQVKPWQERVTDTTPAHLYPDAMRAEIAELRAALASRPVVEAGELPALPISNHQAYAGILYGDNPLPLFTADQMRAYGQEYASTERERNMARIKHLTHERDIARAALAAKPAKE